jgi:penicillin-binding protein 2
VALHDAVVQSCDVYFYRLAVQLGPERLSNFLSRFGLGGRTGVDMPGESAGLLPTPEWKRARGIPWYPGDTVIVGIGQGAVLFTPLQLAVGMAAIANRGSVLEPRVVAGIEDPRSHVLTPVEPHTRRTITIADAHFSTQIANLRDVVHGAGGTARGIGLNAPYQIAGKTGTAQVKGIGQTETYKESQVPLHLRDHALFIAFAPVDDPRVAIAVIVENGGHGGSTAAPVARKVMDVLLAVEPKDEAATAKKEGAT